MKTKYDHDWLFDADNNTAFRNNYTVEQLEQMASVQDAEPEPTVANFFKGTKKVVGYGGGWVARHAPEMLDAMAEHDCHHTQYGEDGCDCDLINKMDH